MSKKSETAFWLRNLIDWAAGIDDSLDIEEVTIDDANIRKDLGTAGVRYGPSNRFVAFPQFFELASSQKRLSVIVNKWGRLRNRNEAKLHNS